MDAIGGHVKLSKASSGRQRPHVFSHTWKIDTKDKYIHKNKHDHVQTYMYNMFVTELLYGTWGRRKKGKEDDTTSAILSCITSEQIEDMICIERC
jgi:hypothetical protein